MKKLEGKVALVTGAARGTGAAIAERLAADGASVANYATSKDDAEALAERIRGKTLGRQRRSTRISAILPRRRLSWMRRSNNAGGNEYEQP